MKMNAKNKKLYFDGIGYRDIDDMEEIIRIVSSYRAIKLEYFLDMNRNLFLKMEAYELIMVLDKIYFKTLEIETSAKSKRLVNYELASILGYVPQVI